MAIPESGPGGDQARRDLLSAVETALGDPHRVAASDASAPADRGSAPLCVGGGHVVEALNTVFRVFNADGTGRTGVVDLNTFFGYPNQIDRTTGVIGRS